MGTVSNRVEPTRRASTPNPLDGRLDRRRFLALGLAGGLALATHPVLAQKSEVSLPDLDGLPLPPSDDTVDILHGVRVPDPFRPLEDPTRADVKAWVAAHDRRARDFLDTITERADIADGIRDLNFGAPPLDAPIRIGRRTFLLRATSVGPQRVLTMQEEGRERRTIVNPNPLSPDRSIGIATFFVNRNGTLIAYLLAASGADREEMRVYDVEAGRDLPDRLAWCRHSSVAWLPDSSGFYYTRPPIPEDPDPRLWDRRRQAVWRHLLGKPQAADERVFDLPDRADLVLSIATMAGAGGGRLRITVRHGNSRSRGLWIAPLATGSPAREIVAAETQPFVPLGSDEDTIFALTRRDAPRGRIVRIKFDDAAPERWQTLVAEGDGVIDNVLVLRDHLVVRTFVNGGHKLAVHDKSGRKQHDVDLGRLVRIELGRGAMGDPTLLMAVDSYLRPRRIERLTLATGRIETMRPSETPRALANADVMQVQVVSKDGRRVPLVIVHPRDMPFDGSRHAELTGYGSYGVTQLPYYSSAVANWVAGGGVYAVASLRGGGELGQDWHEAGRAGNKQRTFDDFHAAAEWLTQNGMTAPQRLGITGGSSGGLLVLTAMLQRPELYGAVVATVPLADMLRFHKFTIGTYWRDDYGDPDRAEDFRWLHAISALHNVKADVRYPPLLVITADSDDRVVPAHAYKMVATLLRTAPGTHVWLKTELRSGHGDRNTSQVGMERRVDTQVFLRAKLQVGRRAAPR